MKFRKKPVVIEATQWHLGDPMLPGMDDGGCGDFGCSRQSPQIHTLEGSLHVSSGDWIITGVKGEIYPCKPDIFSETYEAVDG